MLIVLRCSSARSLIKLWIVSGLLTFLDRNRRAVNRTLMTERNQPVSDTQMRGIVALGKKCSKTAFPNPAREGCPKTSTLRAMAYRDKRLALEDLPISHVVTCSPCYQEYTWYRRIAAVKRGLQVAAASLVLLAAVFAAVRFVQDYTGRSGQPSISQKQHSEPPERVVTKPIPAPTVPLALTVNLAPFSPTRGEDAGNLEKSVQLPPKLLRVKFLLPLGMEPGEYEVRLQDSGGTAFIEARRPGTLHDGITSVELDLNFIGVSQRRFTMMIRPRGLSWRTFPVVVE